MHTNLHCFVNFNEENYLSEPISISHTDDRLEINNIRTSIAANTLAELTDVIFLQEAPSKNRPIKKQKINHTKQRSYTRPIKLPFASPQKVMITENKLDRREATNT
jgi:hypothetical protein